MNAIQKQFLDQNNLTKIFAFIILSLALVATADNVIRVIDSRGETWYRCESECLIIPFGNGGHIVIGVEGRVYELDGPAGSNTGEGGNNGGIGSGSIGGGGGEGSGTGSDSGGGYYPFIPSDGGSGTACPGGTSMECDSEGCTILCHQN